MSTVQTKQRNHHPMKPVLVTAGPPQVDDGPLHGKRSTRSHKRGGRVGITLAVLASLLSACASSSYLGRAEQACNKYSIPDERAACEKKNKDAHAAFEKHLKQEEAKEKQAEASEETKVPKNTLCFKRQSTGETVCPN